MKEIELPQIETDRFLLRQIKMDDLDDWIRLKYADPEMMRFMPKSDLTPMERAERAFQFFRDLWPKYGFGAWVITDRRNDHLLGDCYLEPANVSGSGEVEIGYDVGREYWGQGVATEASLAALRFTFENTPVERIAGVAVKDNIGSWRVLERLGFVFEREAHLYDLDVVLYMITREQFRPGNAYYRVQML